MRLIVLVLVCAMIMMGCQSRTGDAEIIGQVSRNDVAAVQAFLKGGGDPNTKSQSGDPLLYIATGAQGGYGVARVLIAAGADVNGVSKEGRPVLHNAAGWCSVDVVALLLAKGADASVTDARGDTTLDAVCKTPQDRRAAVIELLSARR